MKTTTIIAACLVTALCAHGQNLILNGDFAAGNTNFGNDYLYSPAYMTLAGTYCVTANPASVHYLWASFGDHTTGAGLMLAANGNSSPTNVVWRQTVSVSPNAAYLFSAWAASAYPSNPGRFFLFVNGAQQGNVVDLPSTTGLWKNYSVIWSSAVSVSALLEIRMLTTAAAGNDFVLDDLSFRGLTVSDPLLRLSIHRAVAGAAVELSWPSVTNQLYQVQWLGEVVTNQWFSLGPPLAGNGRTNSIVDPLGNNSKRFYRVLQVN